MGTPMPIIGFGPVPNSYFIAVGMRFVSVNLPDSLKAAGSRLPEIQIKWLSIDPQGAWILQNAYTNKLEHDDRIQSNIVNQCYNRNLQFVSFGPLDGYTQTWVGVGADGLGNWTGIVSDQQLANLNVQKASVGGHFDQALRGILLGKGSTMIFMYGGGFGYYTDNEAEGGKLEKVMNDYVHRQPPWTIERSSVLCPWNIDYFYLKFKNTQTGLVQMHWNLPPSMDAQLKEMWEVAESPEGQAAIARHEQMGMANALNNLNTAVATGNALRVLSGDWRYKW